MPVPLTEEQRASLSIGEIKQQAQNLATAQEKAGQLQAIVRDEYDRIETVDDHQAVLGKVLVNGQPLDMLLTEGDFDKTRLDLIADAEKFGYRLATREEHLAYVDGLLGKEADGLINVNGEPRRKALAPPSCWALELGRT